MPINCCSTVTTDGRQQRSATVYYSINNSRYLFQTLKKGHPLAQQNMKANKILHCHPPDAS